MTYTKAYLLIATLIISMMILIVLSGGSIIRGGI